MDNEIETDANVAKVFSALADPVRRQILDLVALKHQASATAIAAAFPISRQAVTKHLAVLADAGLVTHHRDGREVLYTLNPAPITAAATWLTQRANTWNSRLTRLKSLAESSN